LRRLVRLLQGQFARGQSVQFGTDIGHAAGNHQASGTAHRLAFFNHPQNPQGHHPGMGRRCGGGAGAMCRAGRGAGRGAGHVGRTGADAAERHGCCARGWHNGLCAGRRGMACGRRGCGASPCSSCTARRKPRNNLWGATGRDSWHRFLVYISMVLRISPTARPSISKASPGSTTMVG